MIDLVAVRAFAPTARREDMSMAVSASVEGCFSALDPKPYICYGSRSIGLAGGLVGGRIS